MTNLKSNILISRTNTFINPRNSPTNATSTSVRYPSSKLENSRDKLLKRSISNVGSLFIENQKNFNINNASKRTIRQPLIDDAIRAFKTKKTDLRSKNTSPNSDNSDISTSSSLSSSNNSSPVFKQRPLLNRNKTEFYVKTTNQSSAKPPHAQSPPATSNQSPIQIDLYQSSPTLFYIKEKYKMYLDWLNEKPQNSRQLLNESNQTATQLNWYNYEKIVYLNESNGFDYLKYIQSEHTTPVEVTAQTRVAPNRQTNSPMLYNTNNRTGKSNLKASVLRALSQQDPNKKKSKETTSPEPILVTNLSSSNNYRPNTTLNLKNFLNKLSESKEFSNHENSTSLNCQTENIVINKTQKGVKFDSNNVVQTSTQQQLQQPIPGTVTSLKPILKTSTNSAYTNESYFNLNQTSQNSNNARRVSIMSLNSSIRSDRNSLSDSASSANNKTNINNLSSNTTTSNTNITNYSNLKLPPIVNCSEDFYAVLHDLEKDNLIK